VKIHELIHNQ